MKKTSEAMCSLAEFFADLPVFRQHKRTVTHCYGL
jgi:hypothetical protein